jgi:hypothetical protein
MRNLKGLFALVILVAALATVAKAESFSAYLSSAQEVPATGSTATGWARLVYNDTTGVLSWTVFYTGLSSNQTIAHIHAAAPIGGTASPVITFTNPGGTTGTITGSQVISATLRDQIRSHQAYVNVHSVNFPGGEIRGQIGLRRVLDYDGDGKTDYSTLRFPAGTCPGPTRQITYWNRNSQGVASNQTIPWGDACLDFPAPGDYDGDGKDDLAIYRAGAAAGNQSFFFILRSSDNTAQIESWGLSGDQAVSRDYDGDGKTDIAIFRRGALATDQTTWWIRQSSNGAARLVPFGLNGNGTTTFDTPIPGDYDGDGKFDLAVYRFGLTPVNSYIVQRSSDSVVTFQQWGNFNTDYVAPGDFDGDGKFDLVAARINALGTQMTWFIRRSSDGVTRIQNWGLSQNGGAAQDLPTQGDYDGDGVTDISVWRPAANGNDSAFYTFASFTGTALINNWGINGDFCVNSFDAR